MLFLVLSQEHCVMLFMEFIYPLFHNEYFFSEFEMSEYSFATKSSLKLKGSSIFSPCLLEVKLPYDPVCLLVGQSVVPSVGLS